MEKMYISNLWPKDHDGKSRKVNGSYTHTLYTKWFVELFGMHRIALDLYNMKKMHFESLLNFKEYLKRLSKKEHLQYCTKNETQKSYNNVTKQMEEDSRHTKNLINSYNNEINEYYKIITSEKYAIIHDKYKEIVTTLLKVVYPDFVRDLTAWTF